jgi:hypothetical protein
MYQGVKGKRGLNTTYRSSLDRNAGSALGYGRFSPAIDT